MKKVIVLLVCLISITVSAHSINYQNQVLRHWTIVKEHRLIEGSFSMVKEGEVYVEDAQNVLIHVPFEALSKADQDYVRQREVRVKAINSIANSTTGISKEFQGKIILIVLFLIALT